MERGQDGGVLDPNATVDASGKTMLDVLKEKHLQPREAQESVFLPCDELPLLTCVDITGAHLEMLLGKSKEGLAQVGQQHRTGRIFSVWVS